MSLLRTSAPPSNFVDAAWPGSSRQHQICSQPSRNTVKKLCMNPPPSVGLSGLVCDSEAAPLRRNQRPFHPRCSLQPRPLRPPTRRLHSGHRSTTQRRPLRLLTVTANAASETSSPAPQSAGSTSELGSSSAARQKGPAPVEPFPWSRVILRFLERTLRLLWQATKWILVPCLVITTVGEVLYAWREGQAHLVLVGLILGSSLAGALRELWLEAWGPPTATGMPWHLVAIGFLFALIKGPGPSYPPWGRVIFPALANGGLWQTGLLYLKWLEESAKASRPKTT